jgi:hypothetical protein
MALVTNIVFDSNDHPAKLAEGTGLNFEVQGVRPFQGLLVKQFQEGIQVALGMGAL